jgi:hypothetical protein
MKAQNNFSKAPIFLSLVFFCVCITAFIFLYSTVNNYDKDSQLKETEWQDETLRRDEIKQLNHSVIVVQQDKTELETHFAQSSDIVPFLDTIEKLSTIVNSKAEVTSVDIATDHTGLVVNLKASGTFGNLYKFLTLLENSPYELDFSGVDMRMEGTLDTTGKKVPIPKWDIILNIKLLSFVE